MHSPAVQEDEASSDSSETNLPTNSQNKFGCITLGNSVFQITNINNTGYVKGKTLIQELAKFSNQANKTMLDIIMGQLQPIYIATSSTNFVEYETVVPLADAAKAFELLQQHQHDSLAIKPFGKTSGIATLAWPGNTLKVPYIILDKIPYIPSFYLNKVSEKDSLSIPASVVNGWQKAHILIEMHKINPKQFLHHFSPFNDIYVSSLYEIQKTTSIIINFFDDNYLRNLF